MKADELRSLLLSLGLSVKPAAQDFMLCCPFHGESNPSLGVSIVKQNHSWGCFSCGVKGKSVVSFISKLLDISALDAKKIASKYGVVELPDEDYKLERELTRLSREDEHQRFVSDNYQLYIKAREGRSYHGLKESTLLEAKVGYDKLNSSFILPWPDSSGKGVYGFTSHSSIGRYKLLPVGLFKFKDFIYHPFPDSFRSAKEAIIVEGNADALKIFEVTGKRNVISICGTILTSNQATLIKRLGVNRVVTLADPDYAGRKMAADLVERLSKLWVFEGRLEKNDPADSSKLEIVNALNQARLVL